mmetsp:Transcript_37562/g.43740  ORF Transcript_37562/g.43740 Transcript_37562/m.43740 type:complete len:300 (+) Transcript_37562:23-922(+)
MLSQTKLSRCNYTFYLVFICFFNPTQSFNNHAFHLYHVKPSIWCDRSTLLQFHSTMLRDSQTQEPSQLYALQLPEDVPPEVRHPVIDAVYPAMLDHIKEFGHPNIPLGNPDGKRCATLRRLYAGSKLSPVQIDFLQNQVNFRFISFDDIYHEVDFDIMLARLVEYESEYQTNYQIPKKFNPDPALGGWVINLRRLGSEAIRSSNEEHYQKLENISFAWKSDKKCGSSFMSNYRLLKAHLERESSSSEIMEDTVDKMDGGLKKWLKATIAAADFGNVSESRIEYMDDLKELYGFSWRSHD